jgi:hypothetical protein
MDSWAPGLAPTWLRSTLFRETQELHRNASLCQLILTTERSALQSVVYWLLSALIPVRASATGTQTPQ